MTRKRLSNDELAREIAELALGESLGSQSPNPGWGAVEPGWRTAARIRRRVLDLLNQHRPPRKTRVVSERTHSTEEK